jgi:lipopolysaccharide export system permease protein
MNLYSRHTIKRLAKGSLISISVMTLIISSITFLSELGSNKIYKILDTFVALKFFLFSTIPIILIITPISTCCTALYVYHNMETDRELAIWGSVGLSRYQIAKPVIKFAVFITVILTCVTMFILPITKKHIKTSMDQIKNTPFINAALEEKSFNRVSKSTTIYADKISEDGKLEGVIVYIKEKDGNSSITVAEKADANLKDNASFRLYNGNRHTQYSDSQQTLFFKTLIMNLYSHNNTGSSLLNDPLKYIPAYDLFKLQNPERFNELVARTVLPLINLVFIILPSSMLLSYGFSRRPTLKPLVYSCTFPLIIVVALFVLRGKTYDNLAYAVPVYALASLSMLLSISILKGNLSSSYISKKLQKIVK